jgi:YesN/AraC family two-component response regulator
MDTPQVSGSPISLLYVEDDTATLEALSLLLAKKFPDMSIHRAENGEAGLELFKECHPDIVLTDISMPVMDGIQMSHNIRALDSKVDIIAASAFSDAQHLSEASNVDISRYLLKPLNLRVLFETMNDCIDRVIMKRRLNDKLY